MWRKWAIGIGVALILAGGTFFGVNRFRYRFVHTGNDLLRWLPQGDVTIFFADVAGLRHAGYLGLFTNARAQQDADYSRFVEETGFDYSKDLDTMTGAADGHQMVFMLRGRFAWSQIRQYATRHGGGCANDSCSLPGSTPGRWVSFRSIQPDVIALAVSDNRTAVLSVTQSAPDRSQLVDAPIWIRPSHAILANPVPLPLPLRILAISLQSSDSAVLSLKPGGTGGAGFSIEVNASCTNAATAETARTQFEENTRLLKIELAREHKAPDPADLTGVLAAGTFQVVHNHVIGTWPVRRELLASLE